MSRRLDISSLLCPPSPPPPHPPPSPPIHITDPVVLAPHLRNTVQHGAFPVQQHHQHQHQHHSPHSSPCNAQDGPDIDSRTSIVHPQSYPPESRQRKSDPSPYHRPISSDPSFHSHPSARAMSHSPLVSSLFPVPRGAASPTLSPVSSYLNDRYSTLPSHKRASSSPRLYRDPSASHRPPSSPFTHSPPHDADPYSRTSITSTPYPNLPHTRSSSNSNPSPTQSNPFSMSSNPSSTGSTPASLSPVLSKTKKVPYSGLEALVHVASEERRRLSSSEGIEESRASTSPTLDDVRRQHRDLSPMQHRRVDDFAHAYRNGVISPTDPELRPHKRRKRSGSGSTVDRGVSSLAPSEDERYRYAAIRNQESDRIATAHDGFPAVPLTGPGLRGPGMMETQSYPGKQEDGRRSSLAVPPTLPETLDAGNPGAKEPKKKAQSKAVKDRDKHKTGEGGDEPADRTDTIKEKEPDAHEWLLEHYAPSSNDMSTKVRTPTPQAVVAALEQELENLPVVEPAAVNEVVKTEIDVEHTPELSIEVGRGGGMEVDVEDELLSLVDDRPAASKPPHLPSKDATSFPPSSTHKHPSLPPTPVKSTASPSPFFTHPVDTRPSGSPTVSTPVPERGSMPPPTSTTVRSSSEVKDRAGSATAAAVAKKKKDGASKTASKPKQPPKPRGKPGPKPKNKNPVDGATVKGTATATLASRRKDTAAAASRSRSTSAMPGAGPDADAKMDNDKDGEEVEEKADEDDKQYCVCKTKYDEDRVMIACDRCDEWYHTQCVDMPDLEIDLVDQFICPPCIASHPHLSLQTTYRKRCLFGLTHPDPSSPNACHKASRGAFSKYCSDECGTKYMQSRVDSWTKKGGKKDMLWESVKGAEKREGVVVVCEEENDHDIKMEVDEGAAIKKAATKKSIVEREVEQLNVQLDRMVQEREQLKKEMEVIVWREKLTELATERSERLDQCGWDQRLCFGDEEWADFGAGVLESYEEGNDSTHIEGDGEWWCTGKKKCDRHVGWQKLRSAEVSFEKETKDNALSKLTTREREIRKRIEDILEPQSRHVNDSRPKSPLKSSNTKPAVNGYPKTKINGDARKGKKRKAPTM